MTYPQPNPEQYPQFDDGLPPQQPPKRRRRWPWITGGAVVLLIAAGAAAGATGNSNTPPAGAASNSNPFAPATPDNPADNGSTSTASQLVTPATQTPDCSAAGAVNVNGVCKATAAPTPAPATVFAAPTTTTEDTPAVPPQEQQAIGAAQDYLSFTAFSRDGLIRQLSSSAGDGYPKDVATAAVDSLGEDWNAEAAKAAANYLSLTHFSCSGLIQQLDSSAGDEYTVAQATYGAHQTSACSG